MLLNFLSTTFEKGESAGNAAAEVATTAANAASEAVTAVQGSAFGSGNGILYTVLYIVAIIGIFYFFAFRPQLKKDKALKALQSSINVGDSVMTTSGFYGKVVDISDQVFVIEFGTNKGIRIPVAKNEIVGIKEPNLTSKSSEN